jgi:acetyl esterase/lipase
MSTEAILARLAPGLRDGLADTLTAHLPAGPLDVATVRALDDRLRVDVPPAVPPREEKVTRPDGSPLELRVHGPERGSGCVLWLHGGGMFLGSARVEDARCCDLATALGTSVIAADYRLAPEHPHPAPLTDADSALAWCAARYGRVVVAGGSAGGGLAAALCLLARDTGGPPITAAHLYDPMLDDRHSTASARDLADTAVWNRRLADLAWAAYLGGRPADALAAPARATDLRGLPPTYLDTGELDLFRDEDADYAARLAAAGVDVRFEVVPGAVHAFEQIAPDAPISRATRDRRLRALARDLGTGPPAESATAATPDLPPEEPLP